MKSIPQILITYSLLVISVAGCATRSQILINHENKIYVCTSRAWLGFLGGKDKLTNCINKKNHSGYIEIQRAGFYGFRFIERDGGGIMVSAVFPDSPAQKAGIRVRDVIVRINGEQVNNADIARRSMFTEAGNNINLTMLRNGQEESVNLTSSLPSNSGIVLKVR
jgi:S1-C subfamily serine protease